MELPYTLTNGKPANADEVQAMFDYMVAEMIGENDDWHEVGASGEPAFANSWVNYSSGWSTAAFRKIGNVVYFKGLVKSGTVGFTATPIFTLPEGYRPSQTRLFTTGDATSAGTVARTDVTSTGDVCARTGTNVYCNLSFSFSI